MNDAEVALAFAAEAETRLAALTAGLVRLESGLDTSLLAELFREAHTIRGAAAMVGFDDVNSLAGAMEGLLDEIRAGARPASAALVGALLRAVDGLRVMITALGAGEDTSALVIAPRAALEAFQRPDSNTTALIRCVVVESGGQPYAIPMHAVTEITTRGQAPPIWLGGPPIKVLELGQALGTEVPATEEPAAEGTPAEGPGRPSVRSPVVVLDGTGDRYGFAVDAVLAMRDIVVNDLPALIPRNEVVAGTSIAPDGSVLCVLAGTGLVARARRRR